MGGRRDRTGRGAHPRADTRGMHAPRVVGRVLDLVREGGPGGRPQHQEDGNRRVSAIGLRYERIIDTPY